MMKKTCCTMIAPVDNEGGFTLILALILLMLMTIIGVTAINTSTTETMITSANEDKRTAFYFADSAIEQVTAELYQQIRVRWQPQHNQTGVRPDWSFALNGSDNTNFVGSGALPLSSLWIARFDSGVRLSSIPDDTPLGNGYTYRVRIWNNADRPEPPLLSSEQQDTDGLIVVGAIATGPRNSRVAVEVILNGGINGGETAGAYYTAQAGGGPGKTYYNATDAGAISVSNLTAGDLAK